jgi:ubiquinone/menaquinone biosynthesis C-methylase UbiE
MAVISSDQNGDSAPRLASASLGAGAAARRDGGLVMDPGDGFVPETRFGRWFLNTEIWSYYVVNEAIRDLQRLAGGVGGRFNIIADVGCGHGRSFTPLMEAFNPGCLIGIDREASVLRNARARAAGSGGTVILLEGECAALPLADASVDAVFCHQTFHHLADQSRALREFHRVLHPGGVLMLAESTRAYIESWIIRLLFRHPAHSQRSAEEYLAMVRAHGFSVPPSCVSYPYTWWSRTDIGLREAILGTPPPPHGKREETLINLVAVKVDTLKPGA